MDKDLELALKVGIKVSCKKTGREEGSLTNNKWGGLTQETKDFYLSSFS